MARMLLLKPLPIMSAAATFGTGAANLLTPNPKEVYFKAGFTGEQRPAVTVDLGEVRRFDSIFLGFLNNWNTDFNTWSISAGVAGPLETVLLSEPAGTPALTPSRSAAPHYRHAFHRTAAPVLARYLQITIFPSTNAETMVGILAVGLAFETTWNREWGGGRRIIDTGTVEALPDGGFATSEGAVKGGFRWTWGDLDDAEVDAIYDIGLDRGERRPVIVVEDPDRTAGLNERLHYGLFERFEPYERIAPRRTRWSLGVQQWV